MRTIYNFKNGTDYAIVTASSGSAGYICLEIKNDNFKKLLETQLEKIDVYAYFSVTASTPGGQNAKVVGGVKVTTFVFEEPSVINSNKYCFYMALYGASRFNQVASQVDALNVCVVD